MELFLKEKSYGKKTKVDKDVLLVPGDQSNQINITWWPVRPNKSISCVPGNRKWIFSALPWRKKAMAGKQKLTRMFFKVPSDQSNQINIQGWLMKKYKSISCVPGNRKWNYVCPFLKEKSYGKKTKVDKDVLSFSGDKLEQINPFPVFQETGNGMFSALSWRKKAMARKQKLTWMFLKVPGDQSNPINI